MLIYACPGNEQIADALAFHLAARRGIAIWHKFPDGETLVRIDTPPQGEQACLVCTLNDPNPKVPPLLLAAETLRDMGASRVGLVAPYLAYMRQDTQFHPGEAVSSRYFNELLSRYFDWLATIDPHLHRTDALSNVFAKSNCTAHAGKALGDWIRAHVEAPFLIGPDGESGQWVSAVAEFVGSPWCTLKKERLGDREVRVSLPDGVMLEGRNPVLVDDILSSGQTMAAAAGQLKALALPAPVCVAVHGIFAEGARGALRAAGVEKIAVTNTILQPEAVIDVAPILAAGMSWLATGEAIES